MKPEGALVAPEKLEVLVNGSDEPLRERPLGGETLKGGEPGMEGQPSVNNVELFIKVFDNIDELANNEGIEGDASKHQSNCRYTLDRRLRGEIPVASGSKGGEHEVAAEDELLEI